jgi:large subunit ribosomal protein L14
MLQERSILTVADNTGAMMVRLFSVTGFNKRKNVDLGDLAMGSVYKAAPNSKVPKGSKVQIRIVRTKRKVRRLDGSTISFSDNACVIVNKGTKEMTGTRVFGPVARELRDKEVNKKIISLAEEVL